MKSIKFGNYWIGKDHKPFIIAEMSGNHNQSLDRALEIIRVAAASGAHAIKLQTYTADTMTMKGAYTITDPKSLWNGRELWDLYNEAHTPWEWHKPMFELARLLGVEIFSTPFDDTAVDFLESLGVAGYKIASFENTDLPLLKKVAQTGKPVIISTGAATLADVDEAVRTLRANGCEEIVLLKCTSTYPATPEFSNILTIPFLESAFNCLTGLSDHTMGLGVPVAAVAHGAVVIEKHFTLNRADGGVDSAFSMEPQELKALVIETERAWQSLGIVQLNVQEAEKPNLAFKRSLYAGSDIKAGEAFSIHNVRIIRPGFGLAPKFYDMILGKHARTDIKAGSPINLENI